VRAERTFKQHFHMRSRTSSGQST